MAKVMKRMAIIKAIKENLTFFKIDSQIFELSTDINAKEKIIFQKRNLET